MVASVNEAELAARKTDEVCKTVLRGTTFFFVILALFRYAEVEEEDLQPSRFGSRKVGLDQSS